jgi:transketolase
MRAALRHDSPVYIRIGKKGEPKIFKDVPDLKIGKVTLIRSGTDVALLSTGTMMPEVLAAADSLSTHGISAEVISVHSIKPLDGVYLSEASRRFRMIVTIEEHGVIGGLGGAVAEWRSTEECPIRHMIFGTPDVFMHEVGSQEYARHKYGLGASNLVEKITTALKAG